MRKQGKHHLEDMKKSLQAFLINLIVSMAIICPFIIADGGIFAITNDFNFQTIDFGIAINDAIKSGYGLWSPFIDLGSDIVSVYSWNNIASPFYIWTLIFPAEYYPYLIGYAYMIKYAVAGLSSYLYISYFLEENKKKWAILGSVLYSFCGFQCVNMIFQFHDIVALFPLLTLAIEKKADAFNNSICNGSKKPLLSGFGMLALAVFLNGISNYFIFTEEVLFLVIYYVIRVLMTDRVKKKIVFSVAVATEGIVGAGMAALILLPAYMSILKNSRTTEHFWGGLLRSTREYLRLACAVLFPAEPMTGQAYIKETDFSSLSLYIPFVGIALVICLMYRYFKEKNIYREYRWLVRLTFVMGACVVIPFMNNYYTLWSTDYYRWLFIPSLFIALCSTIVLSDINKYPVRIISAVCAISALILGLFMVMWDRLRVQTVFDQRELWKSVLTTTAGYFLLAIFGYSRDNRDNSADNERAKKLQFTLLLIMTCIFSVYCNAHIISRYRGNNYESSKSFYDKIMACRQLDIKDFGRVDTEDSEDSNLALVSELPGRKTFSSTVSPYIMDFYESLGLERKVFTPEGPEGTKELLSTRYLLSKNAYSSGSDNANLKMIDSASYDNTTYYIYEYDDYLPMGLVYHEYVTKSEYAALDPSLRSLCMLKYLVVDDKDEEEVSSVLTHGDVVLIEKSDIPTLMEGRRSAAEYIEDSYYSAEVSCDEPAYIFYSIPCEEGWTACVNGTETDIINVNGLMGVRLPDGKNKVELRYENRLFRVSLIISLSSIAVFIVAISINYANANCCIKKKRMDEMNE